MANSNPNSGTRSETQAKAGIVRGDPGGPGTADTSLYDMIGGEKVLRDLVETFYDVIENEDAGRLLLVLHRRGHGVAHSRIEQFDFLSGFLGGPRLYVAHHGHSDVRYMHEHIAIGPAERDAWLNCMSTAIDRVGLDADIKQRLMIPFTRVATMLINRETSDGL